MNQQGDIYVCPVCQTCLEVIQMVGEEVTCCGRPMEPQQAKTRDFGRERHAPIVQKIGAGIRVHVGAIEHPMSERHWIEWIEVIAEGMVQRQYLQPGQPPTADFAIDADRVTVRAWCSLHGLWKRSLPAFLPEYDFEETGAKAS